MAIFSTLTISRSKQTTGAAQEKTGTKQVIRFQKCIIAAGSAAFHLPFIPRDPRIVDSTGALELRQVPQKMLVIGGGIIGLEMATVYSTLGAQRRRGRNARRPDAGAGSRSGQGVGKAERPALRQGHAEDQDDGVEARDDGLWVTFEGEKAPAEAQRYDLVLQAAGRSPNGKKIGADKAGVAVNDRGFIPVDRQMRTNVPHIFAIGDIVGQPMLAHKAVHEAHVAAEVAAGQKVALRRHGDSRRRLHASRSRLGGPDRSAGEGSRAQGRGRQVPWAASGRAIANGADYGFTKLIFDAETHRIVGGTIVGPSAGDMIGEIVLAIEMGADAVDIGKTIHPHPTLGESIGMAAEVAHGSCTDLPPMRKR